jgi:hypothetical protein
MHFIFGIVFSVLVQSAMAQPLVVDMKGGTESIEIKVQNCAQGYYPVFKPGKNIGWKTSQTSNADYYSYFNETVTAVCAPKVCEYDRFRFRISGHSPFEISLLPGRAIIGRYDSSEAMQVALKKFIEDKVCMQSVSHSVGGL